MIFLIVVASLAVAGAILYGWYAICEQFQEIAEWKGYEGSEYFWFCFIFGIAGMILVNSLPQKQKSPVPEQNSDKWRCKNCGSYNSKNDALCTICGKPNKITDKWTCKKCGEINPTTKIFCSNCGECR